MDGPTDISNDPPRGKPQLSENSRNDHGCAREVRPGTVLYKQGGKRYLMEDSANEKASSHFQSNFDIDY
jgi:hypothetical protein